MLCVNNFTCVFWHRNFILGQLDLLFAIARAGRSQTNACRNLHSLIHQRGLTLPLRIHTIEVPVKKCKPKVAKVWVHYPIILPSTWMDHLLKEYSMLLLGGHHIKDAAGWRGLLSNFWDAYLKGDPGHPMSGKNAPPTDCTIPLYLHGDEGRGKYRRPIMVQAWQPCISFKGVAFKNSSGFLRMVWQDVLFSFP